jgi:hypothetical protein
MAAALQRYTASAEGQGTVMTMAQIMLTAAARTVLDNLPPAQAEEVNDAIGSIADEPGQVLGIPGASPAEPFLAKVPRGPDAPVVIYRRAATSELGDWLVVSLMERPDYVTFREAERQIMGVPPAVRDIVNAAVSGATADITAYPGTVTSRPGQDGPGRRG